MTIQYTPELIKKIGVSLNQALELARKNIPVFPVLDNKAPACPSGYKAASNDPYVVTALWQKYPAPLIGVPTGEISGIDALDIDPRHGGDKWLEAHASHIPLTRIHSTRSGGYHYLFKHHAGLRNSAGRIGAGIDVRADGGYIVWWAVAGFSVLNDAPIAPWNDWLLNLALPKSPPSHSRTPVRKAPVVKYLRNLKQAAYIRAALRNAYQAVMTATEGTRNTTLNREVWALMRFAESGELSAQQIANALFPAALAAGLERHEIIATIASALRARGTV